MMYVVYIVDHIHHLLNEPKKSKFAYNSDRREYFKNKISYSIGVLIL